MNRAARARRGEVPWRHGHTVTAAFPFCPGRWYYIAVVPVTASSRRWENPDEMDLDVVSGQTAPSNPPPEGRGGCLWRVRSQETVPPAPTGIGSDCWQLISTSPSGSAEREPGRRTEIGLLRRAEYPVWEPRAGEPDSFRSAGFNYWSNI